MNLDSIEYALDAEGRLVHVDDVHSGKSCGCRCPACGEQLIARKGKVKRFHFAHEGGSECQWAGETVLHLLAKERIQKLFYESDKLEIKYCVQSRCYKYNSCLEKDENCCIEAKSKSFNLKDYYDRCEQEQPYDSVNRRSDLVFIYSKNPNRKLHIEFCVTHKSDEEKLKSGEKIVEVELGSIEDIEKIERMGFVENVRSYGSYEKATIFYGFKKSDHDNKDIHRPLYYTQYSFFKSGKSRTDIIEVGCDEDVRFMSNPAIYKAIFKEESNVVINVWKWVMYKKYQIPNCHLCKYLKNDSWNGGFFCTQYKALGFLEGHVRDYSKACNCPRFVINRKDMYEASKISLSPVIEYLEPEGNVGQQTLDVF